MQEEDVTRKAGVYSYLLNGQERHLSLRAFSDKVKREVYTKQGGVCADAACPEKPRVFKLEEMEADHIDPWHSGGRSVLSNCKMLCKACNRRKGGV
jgi:5-methylcytosine-specific restriction endonuclease McrA